MSDNLTPYVDPTGRMTSLEVMDQNIGQIMDEFNRTNVDWNNFDQTLIMPDSLGTRRVLLGPAPNGQIGLYVSKPGLDILQQFTSSSVNAANLLFNSDQNTLKVALSSSQICPSLAVGPSASNNSQQYIIPHHLGFVPAYQVYVQVPRPDGSVTSSFPVNTYFVSLANTLQVNETGTSLRYTYDVGIDSQNLYLARNIFNGSADTTYTASQTTFRYYIQQETAT